MGTSLIGKAVDFGSKEYGFEPRVSTISFFNISQTSTNMNLSLGKQLPNGLLTFTKVNYKVIKVVHKLGLVDNIWVLYKGKNRFIRYSFLFYKNRPFFHKIKNVSTSTKKYFISLHSLRIMTRYTKSTIIILSTSKGIMTHLNALRFGLGGIILYTIT